MEGADAGPPPRYWEEYVLAKTFGWTPEQIQEADAETVAWFIAFAGAEADVQRRARSKKKR